MKDWRSQAHVRWDCKYHVVICPKYRRRKFYGSARRKIGEILRDLCRQKEVELVEGKAMPDHVHLLLSIPPKYSVAMTNAIIKPTDRHSIALAQIPGGSVRLESGLFLHQCASPKQLFRVLARALLLNTKKVVARRMSAQGY